MTQPFSASTRTTAGVLALSLIGAPAAQGFVDFESLTNSSASSSNKVDDYRFSFVNGGWGITKFSEFPTARNYNESDTVLGARNSTVTMTRIDGQPFDFLYLRSATDSSSFAGSTTMNVVGTKAGGQTVSQSLSIDSSWSHYDLNDFNGLTQVVFTETGGGGLSLDNLGVFLDPPPSTQIDFESVPTTTFSNPTIVDDYRFDSSGGFSVGKKSEFEAFYNFNESDSLFSASNGASTSCHAMTVLLLT